MYKFLGIGAQKAGTTWLYEMLRQHPQISFPLKKEVHYWNKQYPKKSINDYLSEFSSKEIFEGEITPAYAFLPISTIQKIYAHQPELKIIYILRNPIDRAWSSAKMALKRAEMQHHEASDQWFIDHFNSAGSLMRGDYEYAINNWHSVFPANNISLLFFEDIKHNPSSLLKQCCDHLGISNFDQEALNTLAIEKPVFPSTSLMLTPSLFIHLKDIYRDRIISLSQCLEKDLSYWLDKD